MLIDDQVDYISNKLNIPFTTVKRVLKSYNHLLVREVHMGMEVRVGYLLRLVPETVTNSYIATTGYEAMVISKDTSVPYVTVLSILTSYLDMIVDALRNLTSFDIVGLVNFKSSIDKSTGQFSVYTSTSTALTNSLKRGQSVRVKFNINLRHLLKSEVNPIGG